MGYNKAKLRNVNKLQHQATQQTQRTLTQWAQFWGEFFIQEDLPEVQPHGNLMALTGLARIHPAGDLLNEWSQYGCPTMEQSQNLYIFTFHILAKFCAFVEM